MVVIWATPFHLDGIESKKDVEGMPPLSEAFMKDLKNLLYAPATEYASSFYPFFLHCCLFGIGWFFLLWGLEGPKITIQKEIVQDFEGAGNNERGIQKEGIRKQWAGEDGG